MPGIAGVFGPVPAAVRNAAVETMLKSMANRRHIARPFTIEEKPNYTVGADASAVSIPGSASGAQLIFCGELYSSEQRPGEVRHNVRLQALATSAPTGRGEALRRLNGTFSGALLDSDESTLSLFVDRFGLTRIYILERDGSWYFASEAKALLAISPEARQLDVQGLGEWISCGCVLQNRTLFKGMRVVPAGSIWKFRPDNPIHAESYFAFSEWDRLPKLGSAEFQTQLEEVFPRILSAYLTNDTGISLTGGLDGRMVMAFISEKSGRFPCYTFDGPYRECADARLARQVAQACGQPHQTLQISDDFFARFPALAIDCVRFSDGAMDVSGASEIFANDLARSIAPVRLTGNYGSEILRGNVAFRPASSISPIYSGELQNAAAHASETYKAERDGSLQSFIASKQVPWHHYARASVERSQLTVRSPFLDNELVPLAFQAPDAVYTSVDPSLRLIAKANPALAMIPTDRGLTWPLNPRGKAKKAYHDLWARAEYAYDYGMPNWLARLDSFVSPLKLERLFLGRQKFCHYRVWYRDQLSTFVREVLLDPATLSRPWFSRSNLKSAVESHLSGTANHTLTIHKALSLELIQRTLLSCP